MKTALKRNPPRAEGVAASPEETAQIGLVPLIDLSLTLVVIFLIFMPMAITSLIPIASSDKGGKGGGESRAEEPPLLMVLEPERILLGKTVLGSELELRAWLRDAAAARRNHELWVKPKAEVSQDRLVGVLDQVRQSGGWKITLLVLKEHAMPPQSVVRRRP